MGVEVALWHRNVHRRFYSLLRLVEWVVAEPRRAKSLRTRQESPHGA